METYAESELTNELRCAGFAEILTNLVPSWDHMDNIFLFNFVYLVLSYEKGIMRTNLFSLYFTSFDFMLFFIDNGAALLKKFSLKRNFSFSLKHE